MKRIFLSYARVDRDRAKVLHDTLSAFPELYVWFDEVDLLPGTRWKPAIRKAIRESRFFIALLSKRNSSAQGYRHSELRQAIEIMEEFPDDYVFIIPTRIEDCDPPVDVLRELSYADLFPDWDAGVANLQRTLGVDSSKAVSTAIERGMTKQGKPEESLGALSQHRRAVKKAATKKAVTTQGKPDSRERFWDARRPAIKKAPTKQGKPASPVSSLSSPSKFRKNYHYQVGVVDLHLGLRELKPLARGLNSVQSFAYFHVSDLKPSRNALQSADGYPQLDINRLSAQFYAKISPLRMDRVICVTNRFLMFKEGETRYYNYLGYPSPADERVAFGSIRGLDEYAQEAEVPYVVALSYSLVSDLASYFLNISFHKETRGCPLDFTEDHADKVLGLRNGSFCKSCQRKLDMNRPLKEAIISMLRWGR